MELTKEYFDQTVKNLVKKEDVKDFITKDYLDGKLENLELRLDQKLAAQTVELKRYTDKSTEALARMVANGFVDVMKRLPLKDEYLLREE
jgi:hypothetical protein